MLSAVSGVAAGDISALAALNLSFVQRLAALRAESTAASVGVDQYTPSIPAAGPVVTYNRFGQLAGTSAASLTAQPSLSVLAGPAAQLTQSAGYTPAQIAQAYGFNYTGLSAAGQTIAIITAYNSPTIAQDLGVFDQTFGLLTPQLQVVNQYGGTPTGPTDSGWALETALDVEWAHAVAPQANILVVEANTSSVADLTSAIGYARLQPNVSVVSMSFGTAEFPQEVSYNSLFAAPPGHQGITFVASSGDSGAGVSWPSASPNVLAVGGTTLLTGPSGIYAGEIGWSQSGGGVSAYEPEPAYQLGVQLTGYRTTPDVAYDANPQTGVDVYQGGSWFIVGGTSAGTPQWAGLIALADQERAQLGLGTLNQAQKPIYNLPSTDFHQVLFGENGFPAGAGYNFVTGLGSPVASSVISNLALPPLILPNLLLPFNLQPVSIEALLFPWQGPTSGLGWSWGGFGFGLTGLGE